MAYRAWIAYWQYVCIIVVVAVRSGVRLRDRRDRKTNYFYTIIRTHKAHAFGEPHDCLHVSCRTVISCFDFTNRSAAGLTVEGRRRRA